MAAEISALRQSAESLLYTPIDRTFASAAVIVGLGVTVGVSQGRHAVLLALPTALAILFGFLLQMNVEMLNRLGQKRYLEELLNSLLRANVFLEEVYVAPTRQGPWRLGRIGLALLQLQLMMVLVTVAGLGYSVVAEYRTWVNWAYSLSLVVASATLAQSALELSKAYQAGYAAAKEGRERGATPPSPLGVAGGP